MHPAAQRSDAFQEWLKSTDGKACTTWPVGGEEYLVNRLWWAFHAGREAARAERATGEE